MTMTTSQNTISDTVREGQRGYANAVQRWANSVQKVVGALPTPDAKLLDEVVDSYFNVAEQMLITQREFTKNVLAVSTAVATDAARAGHNAA
jgi:BMFP domain-containing protein YqiC